MRTPDDDIPQAVLDGIAARLRSAPPDPGLEPLFAIDRVFCHRAQVYFPAGTSTSVSVHDEIRRSHVPLGELVSSRRVGPFIVRLVRVREGDAEFWRIVETDSRNRRVVILTYGSDGDRAREASARYAADATEVDLASDFDPRAHFFGERRVARDRRGGRRGGRAIGR